MATADGGQSWHTEQLPAVQDAQSAGRHFGELSYSDLLFRWSRVTIWSADHAFKR